MPRKPKKIGGTNLTKLFTLTNIIILIFSLILASFLYYTLVIILELLISAPYTLIATHASFAIHRFILLMVLIIWIIIFGRD